MIAKDRIDLIHTPQTGDQRSVVLAPFGVEELSRVDLNDPALYQYDLRPKSLEPQDYLNTFQHQAHARLWGVYDTDVIPDRFVGWVSLVPRGSFFFQPISAAANAPLDTQELGITLFRRGQGFGRLATVGLVAYAFENDRSTQLCAKTAGQNSAMQRILGRCGFVVLECGEQNYTRHDGSALTVDSWMTVAEGQQPTYGLFPAEASAMADAQEKYQALRRELVLGVHTTST